MHEWLEALQKSSRTKSPGVAAEELRRAETECGVPLPGELGDLYSEFNGGEFEGDVVLFPLHGEGEQPSVLEKTRKMLVGLPVSGVWRFGLKGKHRHLYAARKLAMVEQGDGGGPLPEWVNTLGDEDWLYGTWDEEKKEMRLYRSLSNMLNVLVPPVEHEQFGDRTFARAIAAVQGALSELADGGEEEAGTGSGELAYEYENGEKKKAGEEKAEPANRDLEKPAVVAAERRVKRLTAQAGAKKEKGLEEAAVVAAEHRLKSLRVQESVKKEKGLEEAAVVAAEHRLKRLREQAGAAKAPKKPVAKKAPVKQAAAKKAVAKKAPVKKAAAKKAVAKKAPVKKAVAKKAPVKKAVAKKAPAKKAAAKKAPAKKAAAKKAPAKKKGSGRKR